MTTTEHHRHLAQGPRAFMLTGYRNDQRLTSQTRLTYRQARWLASVNSSAEVTYVVEAQASSKRMDAMQVSA